ncbi:MAG: AGE family epimerase/isomerase [Caldilineaceae bacterium]|nr:AGE family epimerase/isomerase [Caldilineaceae bacterium]
MTNGSEILTPQRIDELIAVYRDGLLHDTLPFWFPRCVDREHGGFFTAFDRDGTLVDDDKGMWAQGRIAWLMGELYSTVEPRLEWLERCKHGVDFIRQHGFDSDGRMFFQVTRDGRSVRKRRYVFTETFGVIALAAYARATGDAAARQQAVDLFNLTERYWSTPGLISPKVNPEVRPSRGIGVPMIMIVTSQILRDVVDDPQTYSAKIDGYIEQIVRYHMKPERQVVMETVAPDGSIIDHFDGRMLNPGHAIEAGWFILQEAKYRGNDPELVKLGCTIIDWMWQWGWDAEYGGILYFRDVKGHPVQEYWHDMKFWWPQNEAIIATLMAYQLTGEEKYARWHQMIHDWTYARFPDPEYGEWFGYLHRDGRVSSTLKGNLWKGPFHMPRMQLVCWKILEEMRVG